MCDERERVLEYVYDECSVEARRGAEAHLDTCETCRLEVAGLRQVRSDLLSWGVPEHGSVWTPFAPARLTPWYRQVPAWGLAAAAAVMFLAGGAGALAAHAFVGALGRTTMAPASAAVAPSPTPAELAALETRLMTHVAAEIDRRELVASHPTTASVDPDDIARQLQGFRANDAWQHDQLTSLNNDFVRSQRSTNHEIDALKAEFAQLRSELSSASTIR